ncbi:MAG: VacJ family lipoprotein [Rhodospirillales bacterium]|nr:VacJ family lipoprotein [Rhodospirillales bacterium]
MSAGLGLFLVTGSALADEKTPPPTEGQLKTNDPFEAINRVTSGFNSVVRGMVIDPIVDGYQAVAPKPVQKAVSNAVSNLSEPVTAVSSLLQWDTENAGMATKRFFVNTTVGVGGLSDPATEMGYEKRDEDLGQALGAGGMAPGPHIVLPIIGPSNMRDLTGDVLTALSNPLPLAAKAASGGIGYSNNQDDIKALTSGALDPYVVERDSYEQNRSYDINNGVVPLTDLPQFVEEEEAKPAAK